jgi:hypothetical protein
VTASVPPGACGAGTSDDGIGNYGLFYQANSTPAYIFFTIQDGKAVEIGQRTSGIDQGRTQLFSQPSGFTKFVSNETTAVRTLSSFSHGGAFLGAETLTSGWVNDRYTYAEVAGDPAGGTAAVTSFEDASNRFHSTYRRFNGAGQPETDWVDIGADGQVRSLGVNLVGHVLVLARDTSSTRSDVMRVRWLARDGSPLTAWAQVPNQSVDAPQFLMDGSVLIHTFGQATNRFEDQSSASSALPDWLEQRKNNRLAVVRNGRGYASWGQDSVCGAGLEVLAVSGKSCGCLAVPALTPPPPMSSLAMVGRDGSLIVPRRGEGTCAYDLYEQLLK